MRGKGESRRLRVPATNLKVSVKARLGRISETGTPSLVGGATCHRKSDHATTKVRMDVDFFYVCKYFTGVKVGEQVATYLL